VRRGAAETAEEHATATAPPGPRRRYRVKDSAKQDTEAGEIALSKWILGLTEAPRKR
jgi:hypothetical protein